MNYLNNKQDEFNSCHATQGELIMQNTGLGTREVNKFPQKLINPAKIAGFSYINLPLQRK